MNDQAIEQQIQAKGLTAPRVTPDDIEAAIAGEYYFTAKDAIAPPVKSMVDRFLGWKLPQDFGPDCGISFKRESDYEHPQYGKTKFEPIGTNLFHADQAKAMFEYCTQAAPVHDALGLLTFCVLVLRNGFTVTGESACASPDNFDAEEGRKIARKNAISKVWPLMGYALKEKLSAAATLPPIGAHFHDGYFAGTVQGLDGNPDYYLVLLSGNFEGHWDSAKDFADKLGGDLPTPREQSLLIANLKGKFKEANYWSSQQYCADADFAHFQSFVSGGQFIENKSHVMHAVAVRRIPAK